jgi:Tfp pilus assembly protein PilV
MKINTVRMQSGRDSAFSLIEVVLAIGIFLVTVLALVGLLGPTLQSVDEVEQTDEVASVVNTLNAFLQNSQAIKTNTASKFEVIYNNVASNNHATIFIYKAYRANTDLSQSGQTLSNQTLLKVGFQGDGTGSENAGDTSALILSSEVITGSNVLAAGKIFRCVLTASSVIPENGTDFDGKAVQYRSASRNGDGIYTLTAALSSYSEGYFAMEVRIYADDPPAPGQSFSAATNLASLNNQEPLFTYSTAVVR